MQVDPYPGQIRDGYLAVPLTQLRLHGLALLED